MEPLSSNIVNTVTQSVVPNDSNSAKVGKKGRGKAVKKTDAPVTTSDKAVFGGDDLVTLIQLVVDKPPYLEPHGSKGAA